MIVAPTTTTTCTTSTAARTASGRAPRASAAAGGGGVRHNQRTKRSSMYRYTTTATSTPPALFLWWLLVLLLLAAPAVSGFTSTAAAVPTGGDRSHPPTTRRSRATTRSTRTVTTIPAASSEPTTPETTTTTTTPASSGVHQPQPQQPPPPPPPEEERRPACVYRNAGTGNRWQHRLELSDLRIGQELSGAVVVQEKLAGAATGPKLWVDCGVGRYQPKKNRWKICNGMLRLGSARAKPSVARKKAAKLRSQSAGFSVYVSRLRPAQDQLEVVLQPEHVVNAEAAKLLQSSSTLEPGQEVTGTVARVEPYGCLVRLDGCNRPGLLHVRRVADLQGRFVRGAKGLEEAGLERGARVRLQVASNERKGRLFLDFTADVQQEAARERERRRRRQQQPEEDAAAAASRAASPSLGTGTIMSQEEVAAWREYTEKVEASGESEVHAEEEEEEEDENYDDYDEERDIEDALGLGTY